MSRVLTDDPTVIERILAHIDAGTTDLSDGVWREPVEHYISEDRFQSELTQVLRRAPTPFCASAALPEAGSYIARYAALTPLIAVRGRAGEVRAFRNACRHRGAPLAEGSGCQSAFSCPYHGWTYGLDGRLRGVPGEHGFPGLDKDLHGLVPVHTVERSGIVFVTQDGSAEPGDLPTFFGPEWRLVGVAQQDFAANWKLVTEGMLEGYHIRATHPETFYPRQYDNITAVEHFGPNSRISFPYRSIEKQRATPPAERHATGALTHLYHLFPNATVSTFPAHRALTILDPVSVERTRLVTYTLSSRPEDEAGQTATAKSREFVNQGAEEDRLMTEAIQRSLPSAANTVFTYGLFEGAIRHFHRNLGERLSAA
jgi:phenylpropionate dioxygenase-like ring-hydroxylating dioxygenase large terminal subunit